MVPISLSDISLQGQNLYTQFDTVDSDKTLPKMSFGIHILHELSIKDKC